MFYHINGELAYKDLSTCVIDCGGVGYKMTVSTMTSEALSGRLGKEVKLFTHLAVREDGIELFGFISDEERSCFNRLTSVSGVGPKVAISILSVMTPEKLSLAICTEDIKAIAKAPGIGSKTAARIILELKDKVSKEANVVAAEMPAVLTPADGDSRSDAVAALMVLGYSAPEINGVLRRMDVSGMTTEQIVKIALKNLM